MQDFAPPPVILGDVPDVPYSRLTGTEPKSIHWRGDDGRNCFLEIQGAFAAVAFRKGPRLDAVKERKECKGFSRSARLRMLKRINRIDYSRAGRCTFVTLTWRDELGRPSPEDITYAKSRHQRAMETIAGRWLCGLWRVEWKKRLSGVRQGQAMPHVHLIYFNAPWFDKREVSRQWGLAIGTTKGVSVKLKEMKAPRQTMYYVSKYVAKLDELDKRDEQGNLDIESYLNIYLPGRKWGVYRPELFPGADRFEWRIQPGPLADRLRALAKEAYSGVPDCPESGFTVFGDVAKRMQKEIDEFILTNPENSLGSTP